MNEFGKYRLFRKYVSSDGVNYTPLDEYQALLVENDSCQCGYRELEYRWDGEYKEDTFKKYEIWNEYSFCPTDSSYDELTGNVDYRNPTTADGVMFATYKGKGTSSVKLCTSSSFYESIAINNVEKGRKYTSYTFNNTSLNKVEYSNVKSIDASAFTECYYLESIIIPNTVTSIGNDSFYKCTFLSSVTIPNSVTSIGSHSFSICSGLTSIEIPSSVTIIGDGAFYSCKSLSSITIPNSVTSIGNYAFERCSGLTSVTIGSGVTTIGKSAFSGCTILKSIEIPDSVTSIGTSAFTNCSGLTSVTIGSGLTTIGSYAFRNCKSLKSITCYATTAPSLGSGVFDYLPKNGILRVPQGSDYSSWGIPSLSDSPGRWTIEYI